jgi:CDP-paratose 2-epimerase
MKVLITGSTGLVGAEAVKFYAPSAQVFGIDNNMREFFFGKDASTTPVRKQLEKGYPNYKHIDFDIRDAGKVEELFIKHGSFDIVIHAAAQPSHDWAKKEPHTDFTVNANGTLVMLEAFRKHSPDGVFIFTSTNKVYGDSPNNIVMEEKATRFEPSEKSLYFNGINESMPIDQSKHSVFGASKVAADIMCQEYGRYFGLKIGIFRCGCVTGAAHAGVELHGFLSYLSRCIMSGKKYTIFGYKGKQVRDNIHAHDLITAFDHFSRRPKKGEVYNMGGSRHSNTSVLEAISLIEKHSGKKAKTETMEDAREGDHRWYISDISKFRRDFPSWEYSYDMEKIIKELVHSLR